MKDIAVVMIHGMGDIKESFGDDMREKLEKNLEPEVAKRIHYEKIYYSDILQEPQENMFASMELEIHKGWYARFCKMIYDCTSSKKRMSICTYIGIVWIMLSVVFSGAIAKRVWIYLLDYAELNNFHSTLSISLSLILFIFIVLVFLAINPFNRIFILQLRKFMMYNMSDAGALSSKVYLEGKPYYDVQKRVVAALNKAYGALNGKDKKVIVVASSLGAHVISNYIWDCQNEIGMFVPENFTNTALGVNLLSDEEKFLRLQNMRSLITTGCNIPLLIGAHKKVVAISTSNCGYNFRWYNYYDKDDILGWPLRCIPHDCDEECEKYVCRNHTYDKAVYKDIAINAGRGIKGLVFSRSPLSHLEYWRDDDVIEGIANEIYRLI